MSAFDKPKATDKARDELNENLANPSPGIWNRVSGAIVNAAIKCKGMVCKKAVDTPSEAGDCPYTKE